jgi:hypothetical protein
MLDGETVGEQRKRKRGRPKGSTKKKTLQDKAGDDHKQKLAGRIRALAAEGFNLTAIADFFEVSLTTFLGWRKEDPKLQKAYQDGADAFISDKVERSLAKRAQGYEWIEVTTVYAPAQFDTLGKLVNGKEAIDKDGVQMVVTKRTEVLRHIPPDPTCLQTWLKNRAGTRWLHAIGEGTGLIVHKLEAVNKPKTAGMSEAATTTPSKKLGRRKAIDGRRKAGKVVQIGARGA